MKHPFRTWMITSALLATVSLLPAQDAGDRPAPRPREAAPASGSPRRGPERSTLVFPAKTLPKTDREKAVLQVLEDIDRTQRRGSLSVPVDDGRFLRSLTEAMGAEQVVEIGCSIGYSGLWFCLALESTGGKLTTFELDPQRAATARSNFKRASMEKIATLIEGDAHQEVAKITGSIDILFLDADKEGYLDYLQKLLPKLRPGGLVIAHNMNERQADPNFVKAITTNPELESVLVNVGSSGISVSLKKR